MGFVKKVWEFFLDTVETAAIAFGIFLVIYGFIAQPHEVKGNSMYSTLEHGDFLLTDKISYRFNGPERGDIVVFKSPVNTRLEYIKRIVALPGETVQVSEGKVFINDRLLQEDYLLFGLETKPGNFLKEGVPVTIPNDAYLVMGDNRPNSSDSREWGTVPADNLIGKVFVRYWPLNRVGKVSKLGYAF